MTSKRLGVPSWEETFMTIAQVVANRSKDPVTQVGACIVDDNNIILALGYNGFPRGCSDDEFPWGKQSDDPCENKYMYVVHAEVNAILNNNGTDLRGSTLYVTLFPCNECAKLIIQAGIRRVIYSKMYCDSITSSEEASIKMFAASGVDTVKAGE